jgi:hypothetical protein
MKSIKNHASTVGIAVLLAFSIFSVNANKHAKQTKYPTYKGLIMAGYQGWFREATNGMLYPDENIVRLDMWPDVSEYEITYPTGLKHADGSTAIFKIRRSFTLQNAQTIGTNLYCRHSKP